MAGIVTDSKGYLVSTDIGIFHVNLEQVAGYDTEDIVRGRSLSQARAVQLLYLGKIISPLMPTTPRSIPSVWLNNEQELAT